MVSFVNPGKNSLVSFDFGVFCPTFLTHLPHFLLSSGVDGFIKGIDPDKVCEIRAAS